MPKSTTVRGIPNDQYMELRFAAANKETSINKTILDAIERYVKKDKTKLTNDEYDKIASMIDSMSGSELMTIPGVTEAVIKNVNFTELEYAVNAKTFRKHAKANGYSDIQIESMTDGKFDPEFEIEEIENSEDSEIFNIGNFVLTYNKQDKTYFYQLFAFYGGDEMASGVL